MFGAGLSVLSGVAGLGMSVYGGAGSLLSNAFGLGEKAGGAVIGGVVGGIHKAMQGGSFAASVAAAIGGALTGAIVAGITSSVRSAVARSQSILAQSQATGWGIGASTRSVYNAAGFGISADKLPQQNAMMGGMSASIYGGDGSGSGQDLAAYRRFYKRSASSGRAGLALAQSVEGMTGRQGFRGMANLDDSQFSRQMSRSSAMQSGLGMNPTEVRRGAQEMTLLGASFSQFFSLIRDKAGSAIIRNLVIPLNNALDWIISHSDGIGKSIERGVDAAFKALNTVGSWLYADFPVMVLSGLETLASTAGDMLSQLPDTFSELGQDIKYSLLDALGKVPQLLGDLFAPIGEYLKTTILPPLVTFFDGIKSALLKFLDNPKIAAALRLGESVLGLAPDALATEKRITDTTTGIAKNAGLSQTAQDVVTLGTIPALMYAGKKAVGAGASWLWKNTGGRLFGGGAKAVSAVATVADDAAVAAPSLFARAAGLAGKAGAAVLGKLALPLAIAQTAVAGYGLYKDVKEQGAGQWMRNVWGRTRDIATFNMGHYDETEQARMTRGGQASAKAPSVLDSIMGGLGGVKSSAAGALKNISTRPPSVLEVDNDPNVKHDFNHSLKGLRDGFTARANGLEQWAHDKKNEMGTVEERRAAYKSWDEIAKNTKRSADATEKVPSILNQFGQQIVSRALAYEKEDTTRNIMRGASNI